jgi:Tfp pilus assembly protein PilF
MVSCSNCASMNGLDSAFCRKCGVALPAEELRLAAERLDACLDDGYALFNDGRSDEALVVAESVLASWDGSLRALTLKGLCHESRGEYGQALASYERAVEIDPASALNRIKVDQLRGKLVAPATTPPRRGLAITGAAATVALVIAGGALMGSMSAQANVPSIVKTVKSPAVVSEPLGEVQIQQPLVSKPTTSQSPPVTSPPVLQPKRPPHWSEFGGGYEPLKIQGTIDIPGVGKGEKPPEKDKGQKGEKGAGTTPPVVTPPVKPPVAEIEKDNGVYEITVSGSGDKGAGKGDGVPKDDEADAHLEAADAFFLAGDYVEASTSYQNALKAGAAPGQCNEKLGDCYRILGQRKQAIGAYLRAASIYEARGNTSGAATCRKTSTELQRSL